MTSGEQPHSDLEVKGWLCILETNPVKLPVSSRSRMIELEPGVVAEATALPDGSLKIIQILHLDNMKERFKHAEEEVKKASKQREVDLETLNVEAVQLMVLGEEIENEEAWLSWAGIWSCRATTSESSLAFAA